MRNRQFVHQSAKSPPNTTWSEPETEPTIAPTDATASTEVETLSNTDSICTHNVRVS